MRHGLCQAIFDYHKQVSVAKAERIIAEYDRVVALLEVNPLLFHEGKGGWRVYPFGSGTYLLYYMELESIWLVTGIFHARRKPSWIQEQLSHRLRTARGEPDAQTTPVTHSEI